MPLSGAGQIRKLPKPIGRSYERNLRPVPAGYQQDEILYKAGFWAQFGVKTVCSLAGALCCASLWIFALSPLARLGDVWGMGPTLLFALLLGPLMAALPVRWYGVYRAQQRVLGDVDARHDDEQVRRALE